MIGIELGFLSNFSKLRPLFSLDSIDSRANVLASNAFAEVSPVTFAVDGSFVLRFG